MSINLQDESVLTLSEAAKALPSLRKGKPVHKSTLYRWISSGVRGVRLEALKLGRTTVTSMEALQRFAERITELERTMEVAPLQASRRQDAVEQELIRRGF